MDNYFNHKVEKILKGSLDSIPSPSPIVKIQKKVCWHHPAMFCFYFSSKLSHPWFEFSLKVMGSNPGYLLKSFLLYEKDILAIKKTIENSRLKAGNLQFFWDHYIWFILTVRGHNNFWKKIIFKLIFGGFSDLVKSLLNGSSHLKRDIRFESVFTLVLQKEIRSRSKLSIPELKSKWFSFFSLLLDLDALR